MNKEIGKEKEKNKDKDKDKEKLNKINIIVNNSKVNINNYMNKNINFNNNNINNDKKIIMSNIIHKESSLVPSIKLYKSINLLSKSNSEKINDDIEEPEILKQKISTRLTKLRTTSPDLLSNLQDSQCKNNKLNNLRAIKSNFESPQNNLNKKHAKINSVDHKSFDKKNIKEYQDIRMNNIDISKRSNLPIQNNIFKNYSLTGKKYHQAKIEKYIDTTTPAENMYKLYFNKKMKKEILPNLNMTNSNFNSPKKITQVFGRTSYKSFEIKKGVE